MPNKNLVSIIGHMTADPEMRSTSGGTQVANFSVAVSEHWTDKASNEKKEHTEFFRCTAFGKSAEFLQKYAKKGVLTIVEGKQRTEAYKDKDGNQKYSVKLICDSVQIYYGPKKKQEGASSAAPATAAVEDEIPF